MAAAARFATVVSRAGVSDMAQSEIKMKIESKIYGGRLALLVARALAALGVSEERCVRIAMAMTFARFRVGGKHKEWKRLSSIADGTNGPPQSGAS